MTASLVFSLLSFIVAVPSAIKVFNWTATLYKGSIRFDAPMLYALGFIGLFTIGGLTGLFLAALALDVHLTDTYFVVAHFHYIMVGGSVMAYFGGLHFWWPKITGRLYSEVWARIAAAIDVHRLQPDVLPAVPARLPGHAAPLPRVSAGVPGPQRAVVGRRRRCWRSATCCRSSTSPGRCRHGARAGANPWGATGLEWQTASPPPTHNFEVEPAAPDDVYGYDPEADRAGRATPMPAP